MKKLDTLVRAFVENHPESAARALEGLDPAEAAEALSHFSSSLVGPVVAHLTPQAAGNLLDKYSPDRTRDLLDAMDPRQASVVLRHLEEAKREAALAGLPEETGRKLRALLKYPADTAGGMMEPQVFSLAVDMTVQKAISAIRKAPKQNLHYLYVTERDGRLAGVVGMRDLLLASPHDPIEPLLHRDVVSVVATMSREEVASILQQRRYLALPVLDPDRRLLGVIRHDQVLAAVQEGAFEDLQRLVGAGGDERALSPVSTVVKNRLPWLLVNLATAFLASAVIGLFEDVLAKVVALAVLLPIVAGQGGNTGAQTLAVVIRGLALREVAAGTRRRLILKELSGGLINGAAVALVTSLGVLVWFGNLALAVVIGMAMVVNMGAAGVSGAAIPLALHAMGRDPAQSSSIFMTTVTDIVGFAAFLGFAVLFSRHLP